MGWTFAVQTGWNENLAEGGWSSPAVPATPTGIRQATIAAPRGPVFVNMVTGKQIVYAPGVMVNEA